MVKILANDGIEADGLLLLEEAGFEVQTQKIAQGDLMIQLQAFDVITVRSATQVRKELIDACPNLKIIARGGVGMDNIDVEYAESKGIKVINTPAASSQSVAELAIAHIFSLARFVHRSNRELGTGDFKKLKTDYSEGIQLQGKTLGIIGIGRIGQSVARMALGMGMNIIASDPMIPEVDIVINPNSAPSVNFSVKIKTVSLADVLKHSDVITIHTPSVKALIGTDEMASMKKGALLINCSRGGVIDEDALLAALESGHIGGAGLDVFVGEPAPRPELLNHPKISVTPHIGASTLQAQANIGLELADKIIAFFDK